MLPVIPTLVETHLMLKNPTKFSEMKKTIQNDIYGEKNPTAQQTVYKTPHKRQERPKAVQGALEASYKQCQRVENDERTQKETHPMH